MLINGMGNWLYLVIIYLIKGKAQWMMVRIITYTLEMKDIAIAREVNPWNTNTYQQQRTRKISGLL